MNQRSDKASSRMARIVRTGLAGLACVAALAGTSAGCLDRPVSPAKPNTTNVFVEDIKQTTIDKIDMLFMIDNSISMADKQAILADAVPQLLHKLIVPEPDANGNPSFNPVVDIHIGVISSSLGGHGGNQCDPNDPQSVPDDYDNAHLVPSVRSGVTDYQGKGFLWWDPTGQKASPPGESNEGALESNFQAMVVAVDQKGCGYEASLEAWYRFLVDPAPPAAVTVDGSGVAQIQGPDNTILTQRLDFLRQDSLVAIVMLSDENDCSIIDGGQNWIAAETQQGGNAYNLPRSTTQCDSNPNDNCCQSCASGGPNPGCSGLAGCDNPVYDSTGDQPNLRCWQQKRRFGIDFLYPTARYVEALSQPRICPNWDGGGKHCGSGDLVPNPLFNINNGSGTSRDPGLIYIAGIVGVPWQDLATDDTLNNANDLKLLTADELTAGSIKGANWDALVPKCKTQIDPGSLPVAKDICAVWDLTDQPDDPLMIESTDERTGANLRTGAALAPDTAGDMANPINGHEFVTSTGDPPAASDLQYACIFPLSAPQPAGNDCTDATTSHSPLCQQGASYGATQYRAKGYPGQRELEVLKDYGHNSIPASICPKNSTDKSSPAYGYNPAVNAIIDRLKEALTGKCINRPVDVDDQGIPKCKIVEVLPAGDPGCGCDPALNRSDLTGADTELVGPVLKRLQSTAQCGPKSVSGTPCVASNFCMCIIGFSQQPADCQHNDPAAPDDYGWCYIDYGRVDAAGNPAPIPADGLTNPGTIAPAVEKCTPQRQLRFVGNETPKNGATVFLACLGAPVS